jgi:hypothetical protein
MSKIKPIVTKTGNTFKGPGWNGQKVQPVVQPKPQKTYDPRKGNTGIAG